MGETFGPYSLDKRIGAGGMADVFLARGPRGVCVVKRPHAHLCASSDFVRMFLDEAAILASVHHPNIAQIFDLGQVNGGYYLAMEYVPGFDLMTISLEHERQGELMAPELCARIIADVAGALHHAHETVHPKTGQPLNLIHRDVTPHNVLLSTTGVVKLIDFGVARAATATHRTQAGLVKGKYPYMAPEQITGQDIDRRVDVYALGLVLYELLTNTRAIAGNTEVEQIDNARAARIRPIEQLRPNLPMPVRQILASCVHPDREGRYPTAAALKEDLEKYLRFVGQPIGQEDLLRLFRVVAAEVAHLEPLPPQAIAPTEAQHTWGGNTRTEQDVPTSDPALPARTADELALGVAPTAPSMRLPVPNAAVQPAAPTLDVALPDPGRPTALVPGRAKDPLQAAVDSGAAGEGELDTIPAPPSAGLGRWVVLGGLSVVVIVAGALLLTFRAPIATVADAGVAPVVLAAPLDASALAVAEEPDAGSDDEVALDDAGAVAVDAVPELDAGVRDERAASVNVTSNVKMAIRVGKSSWGSTPAHLELEPGEHVIFASSTDPFCERKITVKLEPGDAKDVKLTISSALVRMHAEPVADTFTANGKKLPISGGFNSQLEVNLCEGRYTLGAQFQAQRLKKLVEVTAGNPLVVNLGVFK